MRIAIYFEQYSWGGTDTHLLNLLRGWPNPKDNFTLFSNRENEGLLKIQNDLTKLSNLTVVTFPSKALFPILLKPHNRVLMFMLRSLNFLMFPILLWRMEIQAYQLFKKYGQFEALISDNGGYPAAWGCLSAINAAFKLKIEHRILLIHHEAKPFARVRSLYDRCLDNRVIRNSTHVVAVSEATKESMYTIRKIDRRNKIDVIYNGIDLTPIPENIIKKNLFRNSFGLLDKKLIGVVGLIEPYKGHDDLILALNHLDETYLSRIAIVFIGSGKDGEIARLKSIMKNEAIRNAIIFTGYIPGEPREIISSLDLLCVMTKDFEGFGLTLAEAMSVGVPILATKVGAIPEFIEEGIHGKLIPPCSPIDIKNALINFLEHEKEWKDRTANAKIQIEKYSKERMGQAFANLFKEN